VPVVVADASPLIFLAHIQRLGVLERFSRVLIPVQVFDEVREGAVKDPQSLGALSDLLTRRKAELRAVQAPPEFHPDLGQGERAGICLAAQLEGSMFLVDERRARSIAQASGIRTRSTGFLLLDAQLDGSLSREEFRVDLTRLLNLRYHLSLSLYEQVLALSERS
jgi:predicted nucleic acid-binding protein